TARTGNVYYLHLTSSKGGKPTYHFSTRRRGNSVDLVSAGYELYEKIGGQVFLRRKLPQLISDEEVRLVKEALKAHAEEWRYKTEVKKNTIILHEAGQDTGWIESFPALAADKARVRQYLIQSASYMAVMRFILDDPEKRLFFAERYCFRGSVEDWISIGHAPPAKLPALLKKFIKHPGRESFYELY
ncbi:MAG: hypothetical protein JWR69_3326, partial [Pedosphaera sp.]|nr:hypothetical protein [Pedosphaera sp.]